MKEYQSIGRIEFLGFLAACGLEFLERRFWRANAIWQKRYPYPGDDGGSSVLCPCFGTGDVTQDTGAQGGDRFV